MFGIVVQIRLPPEVAPTQLVFGERPRIRLAIDFDARDIAVVNAVGTVVVQTVCVDRILISVVCGDILAEDDRKGGDNEDYVK